MAKPIDLVTEAHNAIREIAEARKDFSNGKYGSEQANVHIGLFNATSRILNTAIVAEKWKKVSGSGNAEE